jgi:selenocysteine lyase/cysteine desulfurase
MDVKRLRKEFPVTKRYTFLDHACIGPLSRRAAGYMRAFVEDMHKHGGLHEDRWVEGVEKTRELVACLLGCRKEEVAFTKNTSEGISFVANGLEWRGGDNVVITQVEFPANVYPWLNLKRVGSTDVVIARGIAPKSRQGGRQIRLRRTEVPPSPPQAGFASGEQSPNKGDCFASLAMTTHESSPGTPMEGVEVRFVQEVEGRLPFEGIHALVDDRTRVVSLSFVEFTTGFRNDLKRIGNLCKERGIVFVVDAIQGLGALRLDVKEMGIDFLAADGHKWLMAPEGAGIFYARHEAMDKLSVKEVGWASVINKEDYLDYNFTLRPDATRFECGSLSTVCIYGLKGALEVLLEAGIDKIESRIMELTDHLYEGLMEKGYSIYSSRREGEASGIVSFYSTRHNNLKIWNALREKGIILSLRDDRLRASPHFYNTHEEIDRLLKYLP